MLTDAIGPIGATILLLVVAVIVSRVFGGRRPTPFNAEARRDYRELGERLRERENGERNSRT